jgi:cobalt/nickel transport system ATP-binding protein
MIHLRDVSFRFNSRQVLKSLNFHLHQGERMGLVGPNGAGKSTLCHIIMGLLRPASGVVEIFGKERVNESDFREVRERVGFLFQDPDDQLFCPTVLEDVAFGPLNQGKTPEQARRIVETTLASLKLDGFAERITYQLSGGEKRLVSLATVLAMEPEVLILDEPTNGLDEETTESLVHILKESELTYLVVSHDREFVERTTTKILEIRDGAIKVPANRNTGTSALLSTA